MIQFRKKEAKWQTIFSQYMQEMHERGELYCYYELKQTMKDFFSFRLIEFHQFHGLPALELKGMKWKFSDEDSRQKVCDGANLPPLPSYLVIKFPDAYYMIRIGEIHKLKENGAMGITLEQAKTIAERIVVLGKLTPTLAP